MLVSTYVPLWLSSYTQWIDNMLPGSDLLGVTQPLQVVQDRVVFEGTGRRGQLDVVPLPHAYTTGNTTVCLAPNFIISFNNDLVNLPQDLLDAARRTEDAIKSTSHHYLSVDHGIEFFTNETPCGSYIDNLIISLEGYTSGRAIASIFSETTRPAEERLPLEAYTLSVPLEGPARISSTSSLGLLRGLTTFEQLFYLLPAQHGKSSAQQDTSTIYAPFAPYVISDRPSFPWRAVLLDTSRHYFSKDLILKQLETMSLVKLNVFHWHITDSNSWPLHLLSHPDLSRAAYSPEEIYSEDDVQEIIQYAGERGIDVVLEIDTPGHTATIALTHPDYIACFEGDWANLAHQPPSGQLRFANESVTEWTAGLFESVAGLVESRYVGTGGDEVNEKCMLEDEATTAILREKGWELDNALDVFTAKTHNTLRQAQKTPIVWQEMVLAHNLTSLGKDTIVNIWVDSTDAIKVLEKGYRIVHASGDYLYLDCGLGGWIAEPGSGGNSWCDPFKTWMRIHSFDPYANVTEELKPQVLGGQASLWTEQVDETNLESVLWPRAAALAEVFWTSPTESGYPLDTLEALHRMHDVRYRMVSRGVRATPLQPHWCALRPGKCSLFK